MDPAGTQLRKNIATWAVCPFQIPAVAHFMHDALPNEKFDPHFLGQRLCTTYFDTSKLELRKNRSTHDTYITLRVRSYAAPGLPAKTFAASAKTEAEKFRTEISQEQAIQSIRDQSVWSHILPGHLYARLLEVSHEQELKPVVQIFCQRYAIEDDTDRFTLDVQIRTDTERQLPIGVLEYKSAAGKSQWQALDNIGLHHIKLSKFLWATEIST
jgi:hypothetical protein